MPHTAQLIEFPVPATDAYDRGRAAFQTGTGRAQNPFLHPPFTECYHRAVTEWYRGFDTEFRRHVRGTEQHGRS